MMNIRKSEFICSSADLNRCPGTDLPEYAFIGRSNVGKSSLINYLTNRRNLAKISSKPGKTRLINHFLINEEWYLVDLPGYGYVKTGPAGRAMMSRMIMGYILGRKNLSCLFLLLDARHEPQQIDLEFIGWLGKNQVPFVIVFTKTDKISSDTLARSIARYESVLKHSWETLPPLYLTTAVKKRGKEEILEFIDRTNKTILNKKT